MSGQLQSILRIVKKPPYFTAVIFFSLISTVVLFICGVTCLLDQGIYDWCIKFRVCSGVEIIDRRIATIDINDESIKNLAEQLDTRAAFTDALDILAESNTSVVFDLLFKYNKPNDVTFTNIIKKTKDAVVAAVAVDKKIMNPSFRELTEAERQMLNRHIWHIKVLQKGNIPRAGTFFLPFPELGEAVKQIAHINIEPDPDGIYRRIPLLYEWDGGYIPSLPLATVVLYYQIPVEKIELKAGAYLALPLSEDEVIRIPVDNQGRMLIPYSETWKDNDRRIPFHTLVKAKNDAVFNSLNNRIALIAEISAEQKDFGPTPFERLFPLSGTNAAVISGILNGLEKRSFISTSSVFYKILTSLLVFLVCVFLICATEKDARFHFSFLIVLLFFSVVTFIRWHSEAIYPWFALPVIILLFMWAGSFWFRYKEHLLLRNTLSRYVPNTLVDRFISEQKTKLISENKELTILFSDISGFTEWSKDKNPELVHVFLNDYFGKMVEILFKKSGTVDKFMGDGMLAFFGAPFEVPNHCEQCMNAAIEMQKEIRKLAEKWKPLADIDLKVRIGINIGKVIVGNLGCEKRMEYTVIGADVNLAQRMEHKAPAGGIRVTATVWEKLKDKKEFTSLKQEFINVDGYKEQIETYVTDLSGENAQ
jgi:adenylate cyclase